MTDQAQQTSNDLVITYHFIDDLPAAIARQPDGRPYHAVRYDEETGKLKGDAMIFMALLDSAADIDTIDRDSFIGAINQLGCSDTGPDWLKLS
ncbi:MAG: hypothetical protein AAF556_00600 [Pseudomonadota bacterium]